MSRCFPFPPPGYEEKARTDDPDMLKKKQREKKHKKDKDQKEKEQIERRAKRAKDGSNEKHREKDKKEKHREKKKDKDRGKEKEKKSCSDEKRLTSKSEGHDGEKTPNEKIVPGKSVGDNKEKFVPNGKETDKDRNNNSAEKKVPMRPSGREHSPNSDLAVNTKDSKFIQELRKRARDVDRGIGNHLPEKFAGVGRRSNEGMNKVLARYTGRLDEGNKMGEDKGLGDEARLIGDVNVQNLVVQTRVEEMSRPLEKDSESKHDAKEGTKRKQQEGDDKFEDKSMSRKTTEQGIITEGYEEEKTKMNSDHKNIEKDKVKDVHKGGQIDTHNNALQLPKDGVKNANSETNLRKRKGSETNGNCHAKDIKPSKLLKPTSYMHPSTAGYSIPESTSLSQPFVEVNTFPRSTSSHSLPQNGRMMQSSALFTSDKGEVANNLKADSIEQKLNVRSASQPLSVSAIGPQFKAVQINQIAGASVKLPHPDAKYLSQVLLVPKMEDYTSFDDQKWLFLEHDPHSKKPKLGPSSNGKMPQAWAEAMRIESADVCALPYVIPY